MGQIADPRLRERPPAEWANIAKNKKLGLVLEDHLPELLPLRGAKPRKGDLVCCRQGALKDVWRVKSLNAGIAACIKPSNEVHPFEPTRASVESVQWPVDELLVVREFGEPIFSALVPVNALANGPPMRHGTHQSKPITTTHHSCWTICTRGSWTVFILTRFTRGRARADRPASMSDMD